jgi:membrane protein DedA with SNARE-associated domain
MGYLILGGKERMKKFLTYSIIAGGIIGVILLISAFLFGPYFVTYYTRFFLAIVCLGWSLVFIFLTIIWLRRLISDRQDQK